MNVVPCLLCLFITLPVNLGNGTNGSPTLYDRERNLESIIQLYNYKKKMEEQYSHVYNTTTLPHNLSLCYVGVTKTSMENNRVQYAL